MQDRQKEQKITIDKARRILGKQAIKLTDKEVQAILNNCRFIADKVIDSVVGKK
jgi:hypothetical protein